MRPLPYPSTISTNPTPIWPISLSSLVLLRSAKHGTARALSLEAAGQERHVVGPNAVGLVALQLPALLLPPLLLLSLSLLHPAEGEC